MNFNEVRVQIQSYFGFHDELWVQKETFNQVIAEQIKLARTVQMRKLKQKNQTDMHRRESDASHTICFIVIGRMCDKLSWQMCEAVMVRSE